MKKRSFAVLNMLTALNSKIILIIGTLVLLLSCSDDVEITVTFPPAPISIVFDGTLIGADYWSETPEILSASYGFGDIIGLPGTELTQQLVEQAGGAWLSDVNCAAGNTAFLTTSVTQQQLARGYILKTHYL